LPVVGGVTGGEAEGKGQEAYSAEPEEKGHGRRGSCGARRRTARAPVFDRKGAGEGQARGVPMPRSPDILRDCSSPQPADGVGSRFHSTPHLQTSREIAVALAADAAASDEEGGPQPERVPHSPRT